MHGLFVVRMDVDFLRLLKIWHVLQVKILIHLIDSIHKLVA